MKKLMSLLVALAICLAAVSALALEAAQSNPTPANAVQNLQVGSYAAKKVQLTWTAPEGGADAYEVRYSTGADYDAATTATARTTKTEYTVTGLTCGKTYTFFVRGYFINSDGTGTLYSAPKAISFRPTPLPPTAFSVAQRAGSAITYDFAWDRVSTATGYTIYLAEDGKETRIARVANNTVQAAFATNIMPQEKLTFRIYSYLNVSGAEVQGAEYAEITLTYGTDFVVPVPENLQVTSVGTDALALSWDPVEGAASYTIVRYGASGEAHETIATVNTNSYTDKGLLFTKDYTYYVAAQSGAYTSEYCAGVTGRAEGLAPENVTAENVDSATNEITWDAMKSVDGYELEISADKKTWTSVDMGSKTAYTHSGLAVGSIWHYRVRAYVGIHNMPWSPIISVQVKEQLEAPVITELVNATYRTQQISWKNLGSAVTYVLEISTSSKFKEDATTQVNVKATKKDPVTYTRNNCANGVTYYYRVRGVTEQGGEHLPGPWSKVRSLECAPAAPALTTTYTAGDTKATLTWKHSEGATHYRIYLKTDAGAWKTIDTVDRNTKKTQSYTIKDLAFGNAYVFAVSAIRRADGASAVSEKATTAEYVLDFEASQPKNLKVKVLGLDTIQLTWDDVGGALGYYVNGTSSEDVGYELKDEETDSASLTISGLKTGYAYKFRVTAWRMENGVARYSQPSDAKTAAATSATPKDLQASVTDSGYGVSLTWGAVPGAEGYIITRSQTQDAGYTPVITIESGSTTRYLDDSFKKSDAGGIWFYRIASYTEPLGTRRKSSNSAPVQVQIGTPKPELKLTPVSTTGIKATWNDVNADTYELYRAEARDGEYTLIAGNLTKRSYTDRKVQFGTMYYYKVRGIYKNMPDADSPWSDVKSAEGRPAAPTNLKATPAGGSVKVSWKAVAGATGYEIEYQQDGQTTWNAGGTAAGNAVSYRVEGLKPGVRYYFRVRTVATVDKRTITSENSASVRTTTRMGQVKQATVKIAQESVTAVKVSWNAVQDATGYEVDLYNAGTGEWNTVANVAEARASLTGLKANKSYQVRVRAYIVRAGIHLDGAYSGSVAFTTAPLAPEELKAAQTGADAVTLTWKLSPKADGYRIRYQVVGGSSWKKITLAGQKTSTYLLTGLKPGKTYAFEICAYGEEGGKQLYGSFTKPVTLTIQ